LKLNGTHQLLVYADDVNTFGRSIYIIQENAEALTGASKVTRLEVTADKLSTWSCLEIRMQDKVTI